jgi:hypothetical protein
VLSYKGRNLISPTFIIEPFRIQKVNVNFTHKKSTCKLQVLFFLMEAPPRFELGIKVLQTYALPLGYSAKKIGADYEARTRYLHLGKVALYQMS